MDETSGRLLAFPGRSAHLPWMAAWDAALYGPSGYYRSAQSGAGRDFTTSCSLGTRALADAVLALVASLEPHLPPGPVDVVDLGCGPGHLLRTLAAVAPAHWRLLGVEVRPPPDDLPTRVEWAATLPDRPVVGVLLAFEWLDVVPCVVVERVRGQVRELEVSHDGATRPGAGLDESDQDWLDLHWPLTLDGQRAEVGASRDLAWAQATRHVTQGLAVAVDYAHTRATRPAPGTLLGYRDGRAQPPVPDGRSDITAHVALDACLRRPGALVSQRQALRGLGLTGRPAGSDLPRLAGAAEEAVLLDPAGLGGHTWLVEAHGDVPLPGWAQPSATISG